jgi:hypothetical protein
VVDTHKKIVSKVKHSSAPLAIAYGHHAVVAYGYTARPDGGHEIRIYDNNDIHAHYSLVYSADFTQVIATRHSELIFGRTGRSGGWAVNADEILNLIPTFEKPTGEISQ